MSSDGLKMLLVSYPGSFNGALSSLHAHELASVAIKETLQRTKIDPKEVSEVILGQVLVAGMSFVKHLYHDLVVLEHTTSLVFHHARGLQDGSLAVCTEALIFLALAMMQLWLLLHVPSPGMPCACHLLVQTGF